MNFVEGDKDRIIIRFIESSDISKYEEYKNMILEYVNNPNMERRSFYQFKSSPPKDLYGKVTVQLDLTTSSNGMKAQKLKNPYTLKMKKVKEFLQEIPIEDEEIEILFDNGFETFKFLKEATKEDLLSIDIKLGHALQIVKKCKDQVDSSDEEIPILKDSDLEKEEKKKSPTTQETKKKRKILEQEKKEETKEETPKKQKIEENETNIPKEGKNDQKKETLKEDEITVHIIFNDQSSSYKMKRNTKFDVLFNAFCYRLGFQKSNIRFYFEGHINFFDSTPYDLEMENDETIYAMAEQKGGKPVIMIYSSERKNIDLSLSLSKDWKFDQVYPNDIQRNDYELNWKITTQKDGMIEYDHKKYPYLFYDLKIIKDDMFQFKTSFFGIFINKIRIK